MIKKYYQDSLVVCYEQCNFVIAVFVNCIVGNFHQEEISDPILDITLEAGDMLYFPRGTIHQVRTTLSPVLDVIVGCVSGTKLTRHTLTSCHYLCCPAKLLG